MKKLFFALAAGCIPSLVLVNKANAQGRDAGMPEPPTNVSRIDNVNVPGTDHMSSFGAISPKALKDFAKAYKNVTVENWLKFTDGFSARFSSGGVRNTIYYNSRGKWLASLKGYVEDKMPQRIRDIVKQEYYDYSITY